MRSLETTASRNWALYTWASRATVRASAPLPSARVRSAWRAAAASCRNRKGDGYWEHRHDIGDRFAERRRAGQTQRWLPPGSGFDYAHLAMRVSRVLEYRERCLEILRAHRVQPAEVGVWCHPELFSVYASYHDGPEGADRLAAAVDEMLRLAQEMGGAMEYCHGVGVRLAHLMSRERGASLDVLRSIKCALDPKGIMNPGKLGL